jgi:hypothetical protein
MPGSSPGGDAFPAVVTRTVTAADNSVAASIMAAAAGRRWSRSLRMRASLDTNQIRRVHDPTVEACDADVTRLPSGGHDTSSRHDTYPRASRWSSQRAIARQRYLLAERWVTKSGRAGPQAEGEGGRVGENSQI